MTVVRSQRDVLAWARTTIDALNISRQEVDENCRFPDRYSSKLLAPIPLKRIAIGSMFNLVYGLGHEIIIVANPEAMAALIGRSTKRKMKVWVRAVPNGPGRHQSVSKKFLRKIASSGGKARAKRMNPLWRKGSARKAANARWEYYRKAKIMKP